MNAQYEAMSIPSDGMPWPRWYKLVFKDVSVSRYAVVGVNGRRLMRYSICRLVSFCDGAFSGI